MYNILIVDDDRDFIEITQEILENSGYQVSSTTNEKQAIDIMHEEKPDLVLLDIMMKGVLDGWRISKAMLEDKDLWEIPIIIVSSIAKSSHSREFPTDQYLHARDWLDKPVKPEVLLDKIKNHL